MDNKYYKNKDSNNRYNKNSNKNTSYRENTKYTKNVSKPVRRPCEYITIYGNPKVFTLVLTPHYLDRRDERTARGETDLIDELDLNDIFNNANNLQCYALEVNGNMYLYLRRAWNKIRKRWELELISITPNNHLQTRNRHFALPYPIHLLN